MKKKTITSVAILLLSLLFAILCCTLPFNTLATARGILHNFTASTFFVQSVKSEDLKTQYAQAGSGGKKIKILIVPGHEPDYGGAEYKNLKERNMTVDLGNILATDLKNDPRFDVIVSRDKNGWNPDLQKFYDEHWSDIVSFVHNKKSEMRSLVTQGSVVKVPNKVAHTVAPDTVALRLFGINKWANDTGVNITIHVHFNDYPRSKQSEPGKYSGFAIYVPDTQYSNASASLAVAKEIFNSLGSEYTVSNLPKENAGLVNDQSLIALGQSNSSDGVSILIEYGYIYRPSFATAESRAETFDRMATLTYQGVENFFSGKN